MNRNRTRNEARRAKLEAAVKTVALALLAVIMAVVMILDAAEPPKELDCRTRFAAQERYYEVVDRYGDTEGAVEAAKLVWEGYGHAED